MTTLLTVLDVKDQADEDHIIFPRGLAENTWFRYLPIELAHVLLIVSDGAAKEKDRAEVIQDLKSSLPDNNQPFFDFNRTEFKDDVEKEEYQEEYERENQIRRLYESVGLKYPQTVEEAVDLLVHLKLAVKIEKDGKTIISPVLEPYPKPEDVLPLPDEELKIIRELRVTE